MIELSSSDAIKNHQKEQKQRILSQYKDIEGDTKAAKLIVKAEFDEQFPQATHQIYSLDSLNRFRQELIKSEGTENVDDLFKQATKDLKSFVVLNDGNKAIVFVRKKETGE